MSYQYVKNSRHNLKRRLIYIMGSKCQICGYDKCQSALEFHHIDSQEKDFTLGANANIAFSKAKEEVKKCILVCANCHREIHEGLHDNLQPSYDEDKAQEMELELKQLKTKEIHYCQQCGKIISDKAAYCKECADFIRRKAERPNRDELKKKIRIYPFTVIALEYHVTDNAIRKWCKREKLPTTKKEINSYSDQDWEKI